MIRFFARPRSFGNRGLNRDCARAKCRPGFRHKDPDYGDEYHSEIQPAKDPARSRIFRRRGFSLRERWRRGQKRYAENPSANSGELLEAR
jgi:hypothetical protein